MNIKLPDPEFFNIKDVVVCGEECVLVTPKEMGVVWTEENKFFRSSIWRKSDLFPISLGWKKFTNLGEQPEFESIDNFEDLEFVRKLDGSLAILSYWNNQLIFRTRGTTDVSVLNNGSEIEFLKQKYPKVFALKDPTHSVLFEWTTPSNRIVLKESEEPTLWLIGVVRHSDYSYFEQRELDALAKELGVSRPERYPMNLEGMKTFLETNQSIEGVVVYANKGQYLKKIKTARYIYLHRVFTGIKNLKNLIDIWSEFGYPEIEEFKTKLTDTYDYELVLSLDHLLKELSDKWEATKSKVKQIEKFVNNNYFRSLTRKEQARLILDSEHKKFSKLMFRLLDGKSDISPDKLMEMDDA